jgi:hypothetical protein
VSVDEHIGEAIAALTQYLGCRGTGWEVETLGDLQDHARKAMIGATPCPVCESLGCQTQHSNRRG